MKQRLYQFELPYHPDSSLLFAHLLDLPWPVFLDSNQPRAQQGRYDILSAAPTRTFITPLQGDPIEILQAAMPVVELESDFPFIGGAIGYFSYDLARSFESIPQQAKKNIEIPDMMVGIYDWAIIVDHQQQKTTLVSCHQFPETADRIATLLPRLSQALATQTEFELTSDWMSNMTYDAYADKFAKIQRYIMNGDCYQVNLAQTFSAAFQGSTWAAYQILRAANPVPFGAYLHYPNLDILSLSPERFLQVKNNQVTTKPIKGTRRRSTSEVLDQALAAELLTSEKDRAENVMIVDLLRNDLGRICATGSVQVPVLCALESFPSVHHLVSTVTGTLERSKDVYALLRACFPGGSITGAPKIRAMEIIDECEPWARGIYCGSIGYIDYRGHMDTNIAIRTMTATDGKLYCSAGGALVADSACESEYQETYDKVNVLLKAL